MLKHRALLVAVAELGVTPQHLQVLGRGPGWWHGAHRANSSGRAGGHPLLKGLQQVATLPKELRVLLVAAAALTLEGQHVGQGVAAPVLLEQFPRGNFLKGPVPQSAEAAKVELPHGLAVHLRQVATVRLDAVIDGLRLLLGHHWHGVVGQEVLHLGEQ